MRIQVAYNVNDLPVVEVIERDCANKEQASHAALAYAKAKGSQYFPYYKVLEEENAG